MHTWLIIDCNFLCHRAGYAFPDLTYEGEPTGCTFGFLSELLNLQQRFEADQVVFCFDHGRSKRKAIFPQYKANRHKQDRTPEEEEAQRVYRREIKRLWQDILPGIGYENILISYGYEADDFIARACQAISTYHHGDQAIIIASDHDLFQCIGPNIKMWDPNRKKLHTIQSLASELGISPTDWVQVKAIAGCNEDEIPGAERVGEKTAIKYLRGEIKETHKVILTIAKFLQSPEYARNLALTKLPYMGTPEVQLTIHDIDPRRWQAVMVKYGMDSLIKQGPYMGRRPLMRGK
ncbi:MAG TPA: hypothetical protein PK309_08280 [Bacillota bacterium]|nr:hypothetical protein [Bacillota bacterium]